jgi:hypothetical protein
MPGFGQDRFGEDPFGRAAFGFPALWGGVPGIYRDKDDDRGGVLKDFFDVAATPLERLKVAADGFMSLRDPMSVRPDLLHYLAEMFAIDVDVRWSDDFLRAFLDSYGYWTLRKGEIWCYDFVLRMTGMDITVKDLYEIQVQRGDPASYYLLRAGYEAVAGVNEGFDEWIIYFAGSGNWVPKEEIPIDREGVPLSKVQVNITESNSRKRAEWSAGDFKMLRRLVGWIHPAHVSIPRVRVTYEINDRLSASDTVSAIPS